MPDLHQAAIDFVKQHKKELIEQFSSLTHFPPSPKPFTLFMAGSPGSGKTEFSKALILEIEKKDPEHKVLRLDVDELREALPQYSGVNSDEVQTACSILFDKIYDSIQKNGQNVVVDGTFSSPRSIDNMRRAVDRGRSIGITYLYQDPLIAWEYTQKRQKIEGRTVPKSVFIHAYFEARKNVDAVKNEFGSKIVLDLFIKDKENNYQKRAFFNIASIESRIKEEYTSEVLERNLPDTL